MITVEVRLLSTTATAGKELYYSLKSLGESCLVLEGALGHQGHRHIGMMSCAFILPLSDSPLVGRDPCLSPISESLERAAAIGGEWFEAGSPDRCGAALWPIYMLGQRRPASASVFPYPQSGRGQQRENRAHSRPAATAWRSPWLNRPAGHPLLPPRSPRCSMSLGDVESVNGDAVARIRASVVRHHRVHVFPPGGTSVVHRK